jgi:hypothetical protein
MFNFPLFALHRHLEFAVLHRKLIQMAVTQLLHYFKQILFLNFELLDLLGEHLDPFSFVLVVLLQVLDFLLVVNFIDGKFLSELHQLSFGHDDSLVLLLFVWTILGFGQWACSIDVVDQATTTACYVLVYLQTA